MKIIKTKPPEIRFGFRKDLLSSPVPKMRDTPDTFFELYRMIEKRINGRMPEEQYLKCYLLEKEFMELYERAKAKEKIEEEKGSSRVTKSFYRTACIDKRNEKVVNGLRDASFRKLLRSRKNNDL